MAEKVTTMKLKVDLECGKCYKKVKKVLAKYPQIRDQKFDEKENMVIITVVCCSPEKIRDKLCYKGGGSIQSIEIVEPPKPKTAEPEKKKDADKPKPEPEKKKDAEKPKSDPPKKEAGKPKAEPEKKKDGGEKPKSEPEKKKDAEKPKADAPKKEAEKPKADAPKKEAEKPKEKPKDKPAPAALPVQPHIAPPMAVPVGMLYAPAPCYEGRPVGPGYEYGGPMNYYDGYYARPVYDSYGGGRPCYVNNRCDQYFSDENPSGCTIM